MWKTYCTAILSVFYSCYLLILLLMYVNLLQNKFYIILMWTVLLVLGMSFSLLFLLLCIHIAYESFLLHLQCSVLNPGVTVLFLKKNAENTIWVQIIMTISRYVLQRAGKYLPLQRKCNDRDAEVGLSYGPELQRCKGWGLWSYRAMSLVQSVGLEPKIAVCNEDCNSLYEVCKRTVMKFVMKTVTSI